MQLIVTESDKKIQYNTDKSFEIVTGQNVEQIKVQTQLLWRGCNPLLSVRDLEYDIKEDINDKVKINWKHCTTHSTIKIFNQLGDIFNNANCSVR